MSRHIMRPAARAALLALLACGILLGALGCGKKGPLRYPPPAMTASAASGIER